MVEPAATATLAGVAVGGAHPVRVMGVLNVSPESFYSGSVAASRQAIVERARSLESEGADFIDIGAMSTAPYLETQVDAAEEAARMASAVEAVAQTVSLPISADTSRPQVGAAALAAGARIINDVRGLREDGMAEVAGAAEGVVLMASPAAGAPVDAVKVDPLARVRGDLEQAIQRATAAAIDPAKIVLDPGIGFYTARQAASAIDFNCTVLARLGELEALGHPLLLGVSRKAFLGFISGRQRPEDRLAGSLAATALAVAGGAAVIRTHDVAATVDAVRVAQAIAERGTPDRR